jgi:hypothetical protein
MRDAIQSTIALLVMWACFIAMLYMAGEYGWR